jgi:hypothetical protein
MSSTHDGRAAVCQLLREDPDLADAIPVALRAQAITECVAVTARIDRGRSSSNRPLRTIVLRAEDVLKLQR